MTCCASAGGQARQPSHQGGDRRWIRPSVLSRHKRGQDSDQTSPEIGYNRAEIRPTPRTQGGLHDRAHRVWRLAELLSAQRRHNRDRRHQRHRPPHRAAGHGGRPQRLRRPGRGDGADGRQRVAALRRPPFLARARSQPPLLLSGQRAGPGARGGRYPDPDAAGREGQQHPEDAYRRPDGWPFRGHPHSAECRGVDDPTGAVGLERDGHARGWRSCRSRRRPTAKRCCRIA
jgi:hypothetical protein